MSDPRVWERMMAAVLDVEQASLAPYKIQRRGTKWVVVNNAGMVKATFGTHAEARQYQKALYSNVGGAARKAEKVKWTGTAPKPKK